MLNFESFVVASRTRSRAVTGDRGADGDARRGDERPRVVHGGRRRVFACAAGAALLVCLAAACGTQDVAGVPSTPPAGGTPVAVARVAVDPANATLAEGGTLQFTAQMRDASGALLNGRVVTWKTSDTGVAIVSSSGLTRALTVGNATITATSEGVSAQATVTITPAVVAGVTVNPGTAMVVVGDSMILNAAATDAAGRTIAGKVPTWRSSDTTIVSVSEFGSILAVAPGSASIVATVDGKSGTATISVRATFVAARRTLSAGLFHTCALSVSGGTYCWGHNGSDPSWGAGQLGDGSRTDRASPTRVTGMAELRIVDASAFATCGLDGAGVGYCWGFNGDGQLGDGSFFTRLAPARVAGDVRFVEIVGGYKEACALTITGGLYCWGAGRQLPAAVESAPAFTAIASRGNHSCGLTKEGTAFCWGENGYGQLGNGSEFPRSVPTAIRGTLLFKAISAGYLHTCALTPAGEAYCWGNNQFGQLGGTSSARSTVPSRVSGGVSFVAISAGYFHTCGLTHSGEAYCWGYNTDGALGDGTTTNRPTPTIVAGGQRFVAVTGGGYHSCGLTAVGAVFCWGRNTYGALGDGSLTTRPTATAVAGGLSFRVP